MSVIKNYMWNVGEYASDHGIEAAMTKYFESEDGVKICVMYVNSYDGDWDQFISDGGYQPPAIH
jgi:hypothetical protein